MNEIYDVKHTHTPKLTYAKYNIPAKRIEESAKQITDLFEKFDHGNLLVRCD